MGCLETILFIVVTAAILEVYCSVVNLSRPIVSNWKLHDALKFYTGRHTRSVWILRFSRFNCPFAHITSNMAAWFYAHVTASHVLLRWLWCNVRLTGYVLDGNVCLCQLWLREVCGIPFNSIRYISSRSHSGCLGRLAFHWGRPRIEYYCHSITG